MSLAVTPSAKRHVTTPDGLLAVERDFYEGYSWCLNSFPTIGETVELLKREIDRLGRQQEPWQGGEVMSNVYLLSCAVLNGVEEYLRGKTVRLPRALGHIPLVWTLR
jgi:hypothetical protein